MTALLLLALSHAAAPPPIVNGEPTDGYPTAVLLRHATPDWATVFVCTGTLVTPEWVLTAAHCLTDPDDLGLTEVHVYMGTVWTPQATERSSDDHVIHPDYHVSEDGTDVVSDIALVHVAEPYDLDGEVLNATPITEADVGRSFRYVGWGASSDTANDAGYVKRVVDIPMVGLEGEFFLGHDEDGGATCGGDSGGPVFSLKGGEATVLAGVHSFGRDDDGTTCAGSTSGDTRVDLYLDWIAEYADVATNAPEDAADDTGADTGRPDLKDEGDEPAACGCAGVGGGSPAWVIGALLLVRRRRR